MIAEVVVGAVRVQCTGCGEHDSGIQISYDATHSTRSVDTRLSTT